MKKHLSFTILKGFLPLFIYYFISKLIESKEGPLYFLTYKEIIGMTFFFSLELIAFDLFIQVILFYLAVRKIRKNKISIFAQGFMLNLPLCILWVYGFGKMENPDWIIVFISFLISSIISGFVYLGLNRIDLKKLLAP